MAEGFEDRDLAEGSDGNAVAAVRVEDADLLKSDDFRGLVVECTVDYAIGYWVG